LPPRSQRPLERAADDVLGQDAVSSPVDEKCEQRLGVPIEELLEILRSHQVLRSGIGLAIRIWL
jgi:hypothetical protein